MPRPPCRRCARPGDGRGHAALRPGAGLAARGRAGRVHPLRRRPWPPTTPAPGPLHRLDTLGSEHGRAELKALRALLRERGAPDPEALHAGLALLESTDLRRSLPGLRVPSLWLGGRRDRLVDPRGMAAAAARAPQAHFIEVAGAAHAPFPAT
ncbi:hypothetical protein H1235_00765 [Pseudoxanthomonas sp. NC8]|nr:hypothetical protein H1235_00765 [Pseudoxanthomonas sp. NC8]